MVFLLWRETYEFSVLISLCYVKSKELLLRQRHTLPNLSLGRQQPHFIATAHYCNIPAMMPFSLHKFILATCLSAFFSLGKVSGDENCTSIGKVIRFSRQGVTQPNVHTLPSGLFCSKCGSSILHSFNFFVLLLVFQLLLFCLQPYVSFTSRPCL